MIDNVSEFSNDRYRLMTIKFLRSPVAKRSQSNFGFSQSAHASSVTTTARMEAVLRHDFSRIVVAHLTERDFASARLTIPEMGVFKDYEDWLDFRTSGLFGLQAAGFSVEQIPVDLEKFTQWREATSTLPSVSALDQFAGSSLSSAVQPPQDDNRFQGSAEPFAIRKRTRL